MAAKLGITAKRSEIFMVDPEDVVLVGRDTEGDLDHPLYDPRVHEEPNKEFVANVKRNGVKKPVLVRKVDDEVQVVDGRRRIINAREANIELTVDGQTKKLVPVRLEKGTDDELFETMVLTNAFTRRPSPIESNALLRRYLSFEGKTEADAAEVFGVTARTIKNWLVLDKLDDNVQEAVERGQLSASAASKFVDLSKKEQKDKLKELVAETPKGKRVSVTRAARGTGKASSTQKAPSKKVVKKLLAMETEELTTGGLEDQFLLGVKWAIGEVDAKQVKGLTALLRKAQGEE